MCASSIPRARSSPRSWGCFRLIRLAVQGHGVFPTLVGVFLQDFLAAQRDQGLPHARGGVSQGIRCLTDVAPSSPRSWGCFQARISRDGQMAVFPTLVGVFPAGWRVSSSTASLPHARGGVSFWSCGSGSGRPSSPRSWGCFQRSPASERPPGVFPTLVGVFPITALRMVIVLRSSPRSWGCFHLIASTLSDARSLPHARGGVSHSRMAGQMTKAVFPTLVGVFPL